MPGEKAAYERAVEKVEEKARKEKDAADKKIFEAQVKADTENAIAYAKEKRERKEKERLAELLKNQIKCPACGCKFQLEEGKK